MTHEGIPATVLQIFDHKINALDHLRFGDDKSPPNERVRIDWFVDALRSWRRRSRTVLGG